MLKRQVNGLMASLGLADMNLRQLLTQGVNLGVCLSFIIASIDILGIPMQIDVGMMLC